MPLRLSLRPNEKLLLNGVVLVNGDARAELIVLNDAAILREKEIMTEEEADTVCKQIYFLVQVLYIDQANSAAYQAKLAVLMDRLGSDVPVMFPALDQMRGLIIKRDYYHALKIARRLISTEKELLENVGKSN